MSALRFPSHFPPKGRWDKFFVGVRWLGPDLSFFKALRAEQAQRSEDLLSAWGHEPRARLARSISAVLARSLGWPSEVFLPEDSVDVVFHGPRFDFNDPEAAFDEVVEMLRLDHAIEVPDAFWAGHAGASFGDLIDALLKEREPADEL